MEEESKTSKRLNKNVIVFIIIVSVILVFVLTYIIVYLANQNKENGYINDGNIKIQPLSKYNNPIVPTGFKKVETENASWVLENGIPKGWNNGLVIEDELGNQFVWVPMDIDNYKYNKSYVIAWSAQGYDISSMNVNDRDDKQILKYGGFYIARYEAGVSNEMQSVLTNINENTNDIQGIPVSKKKVRPWNYISLKNAKNNAISMYKIDSFESDLVSAKQWIAMIQWIASGGNDVAYDCSSWGNYSNVNFKFTGLYSIDYGKNYQYGENKNKEKYNMILSSGATDRNMAKNIYDVAGNLLEYTDEYTETGSGGYYCVGGHYDDTGTYSTDKSLINTKPIGKVGFRVALYMK